MAHFVTFSEHFCSILPDFVTEYVMEYMHNVRSVEIAISLPSSSSTAVLCFSVPKTIPYHVTQHQPVTINKRDLLMLFISRPYGKQPSSRTSVNNFSCLRSSTVLSENGKFCD